VITKLRKRIESEQGFTLIEMLIVIIILGILLAIAVPAYLKFRDRAHNSAAQANIRAAIPAMEAYNADNTGSASDADANAGTTGYAGMTLALLQGYDAAIKGMSVVAVSTTGYCVKGTSGTKAYYKTAVSDIITTECTAAA
jgi:type IV pilus assembly protein PilA